MSRLGLEATATFRGMYPWSHLLRAAAIPNGDRAQLKMIFLVPEPPVGLDDARLAESDWGFGFEDDIWSAEPCSALSSSSKVLVVCKILVVCEILVFVAFLCFRTGPCVVSY